MNRSARRALLVGASVVALGLVIGVVWVRAVEVWLRAELHARAAASLVPALAFDELSYRFPRTVTLQGVRLVSSPPHARSVEILRIEELTVVLWKIPWTDTPLRLERLELVGPTLRLVRSGDRSEAWVGFSNLLRERKGARAPSRTRRGGGIQLGAVSIRKGSVELDLAGDSSTTMVSDGIEAKLMLRKADSGAYDVSLELDHRPVLHAALQGRLLVDEERLEVTSLSIGLELGGDSDHTLTPAMRKLVRKHGIAGRLRLDATGVLAPRDPPATRLRGHLKLTGVAFALGDRRFELDRLESGLDLTKDELTIDELVIHAFDGHIEIQGRVTLGAALDGHLTFRGTGLELSKFPSGAAGTPPLGGTLDFSGELKGSLSSLPERAHGHGELSVRKGRLVHVPLLSTIDAALDSAAEAFMLRERAGHGHDELRIDFDLDGDHAHVGKLWMSSRWYGLRGHGDIYLDSRLDLVVEGGPVQKLENELGELGDLLGEITETLVRARVTGTLDKPKIGIEVLRQHVGRR